MTSLCRRSLRRCAVRHEANPGIVRTAHAGLVVVPAILRPAGVLSSILKSHEIVLLTDRISRVETSSYSLHYSIAASGKTGGNTAPGFFCPGSSVPPSSGTPPAGFVCPTIEQLDNLPGTLLPPALVRHECELPFDSSHFVPMGLEKLMSLLPVTHLPFFLYWHPQLQIRRIGSFFSACTSGAEMISTGTVRVIVNRKS